MTDPTKPYRVVRDVWSSPTGPITVYQGSYEACVSVLARMSKKAFDRHDLMSNESGRLASFVIR